jgi:type I restriction enzyme M protein
MVDTYAARRRLKRIHNDLRNRGLNAVEALTELRDRLEEMTQDDDDLTLGLDGDAADLVAIVYQEVLAAEARNGLGQYLTPLPVADLLASVVAELVTPEVVLDPFCGVGLLLDRVGALCPQAELKGVEINASVAGMAAGLARLGGRPIGVLETDAFSLHLDGGMPSADAVVANPPFGAVVANVDLQSANLPAPLRALGQVPAELFGLEVCVDALRPGGVVAIVLPQSVLTNRSWSQYRTHVFAKLELVAVVSLPEETFGPFRGVANSCVVVGRRAEMRGAQTTPYFTSKSVGYSATGRANGTNDLPEIAKQIILGEEADRRADLAVDGSVTVSSTRSCGPNAVRLGDIADIFVGKNPPLSAYTSEGAWLLKVGDLAGSMLPWRIRAKNRVDLGWFSKNSRVHLQVGDVCMTAAGHRPKYIGLKVDIIDELPPEGAAPSGEVMVIRAKPDSGVSPEQLLFFFRSEWGYGLIQELVRGSTGHLYHRDLAELMIPPLNDLYSEQAVTAIRQAARYFRDYRRLEIEALTLAGLSEDPTDDPT